MNPADEREVTAQAEVPAQIFEQFLVALEEAKMPADLVERLRDTIIGERDLSDRAIKAALFPEEESDD